MSEHIKEQRIMNRWHAYSDNAGTMEFELFYSLPTEIQQRLVRVARWRANRNLRGIETW